MPTTNEKLVQLDIQIADDITKQVESHLASVDEINTWLNAMQAEIQRLAKIDAMAPIELGIRFVGLEESRQLNHQFRDKDKPTNVLSFESDLPDYIPGNFIGDLVICVPIVVNEAAEQNKLLMHHFAHMCIHGCLHLLGYDHIDEKDAQEMESLEVNILAKLGIDDPYQVG